MKIYLDDLRATPDGWTRAYTVEEVQQLLQNNVVTNMSLDHDLGINSCTTCREVTLCDIPGDDPRDLCKCTCHVERLTGYDLVKWCAENNIWSMYKPTVHSANPAGRQNMQAVIERYWQPPIKETT